MTRFEENLWGSYLGGEGVNKSKGRVRLTRGGACTARKGACMAAGGAYGKGGDAHSSGGACILGEGGHAR